MKNFNKKSFNYFRAILFFCLTLSFTSQLTAQIYQMNVIVDPPVYVSDGANEVSVSVWFEVGTTEFADFIEFVVPNPEVTLSSNFIVSEEYYECGKNHGVLMPANNGANGIGWGRPGYPEGGSGCGAFKPMMWHKFKIKIEASANVNGLLNLQTNVYGHGFSATQQGFASSTINILNTQCVLICPDNITVGTDPDECGAFVELIATSTPECNAPPIIISDFYLPGTTKVEFVVNENTNDEVKCKRFVTVIDTQSPYFQNCQDLNSALGAGECEINLDFNFDLFENCSDQEHKLVQTKLNDIDFGLACNLGPNHYYRIYDLSSYDIQNDFLINSVEIGVFESFNNPLVEVNIYQLNGPLQISNLTPLHSVSAVLPALNKKLYEFPINYTVPGLSMIVVEVVTPLNNGSFGSIMGFNNISELVPSYISSPSCNELEPILVEDAFGGNTESNFILNVKGLENAVQITANHASGLLPGDAFGPGLHLLSYTATDANGNQEICNFTLEIDGEDISGGVLACNDTLRVILDEECTQTITADMILEGDQYGCPDNYEVIIYNANGEPIGNTIGINEVGQALDVDVYLAEFDNRCSSVIVVDDKFGPVFQCETVTTTCASNITPGSTVPNFMAYNIEPQNNIIPDNNPYSTDILFNVDGFRNAIVTDLNVILNISHEAISDLTATLTAPDGQSAVLFMNPGNAVNCTNNNLEIEMDDQAVFSPADLDNTCNAGSPAAFGQFQPITPLSTFQGTQMNGIWKLTINDDNAGNGGVINLVTLSFTQSGGIVNFPVPSGASFVPNGSNSYIAYGFDACGAVEMFYEDEIVDGDCASPYSQTIYRNWIATDEMGNTSSCTQTIQLLNNGIAFLNFPPDYNDIEASSFTCIPGDEFYPYPDLTGTPEGDLCVEVEITYEDQRIDICDGTFKILRNWKVFDWCTGAVINHVQVILILDELGPIVTTGLPDVHVGTNLYDCSADVDLPDPFASPSMILYDCRIEDISYTVGYKLSKPDGSSPGISDPWIYNNRIVEVPHGDGTYHYQIQDIPVDSTWIKYTFTDPCGNSTESFFEIIVKDDSAPFAICDEHTQVSLGTDGEALVNAFTFDDGSHDNCTELTYTARRMTSGCDNISTFEPTVLFCCADIGTTQMVEFKVTDENGNFSICMVEVEVIDKFPPLIICPANITLDCQADYLDLSITGEVEALDPCGIDTSYFVDYVNLDQCGNGSITRYWYAKDFAGLTSSCYQIIKLNDIRPFEEADISWPKDATVYECESNTGPEITGTVGYNDDLCSLVAVTYKDQVFSVVDDACIKILRKWTVIDWCTFNDNQPYSSGYWEHTQVIKLMNTDAPVFTDVCTNLDFCSFGECEGQVELIKYAHDDCTPDQLLRWKHHVDIDNDGDFDLYNVNSNNASGTYPNGTHRIAWIVEDGCGNISFCEQLFVVRDCKKPTPVCYSQLATVVMNNNGMVEICAEDFDLCGNCGAGSYDNCTDQENLIFSFSANINDNCRTLTCDDIPNGESAFIELEMWVTDEAGNQDYCSVTLDLQDNEGDACEDIDPGAIVVSGTVSTQSNIPVQGVEIILEDEMSNIGFPKFEFTDNTGAFAFENLYNNHQYQVTPFNDSNHSEGVSTLDLIFIQRHILGLKALDNPFQLIAADADNNEKISASDLLSIRKLILGIKDDFPNNQKSWRFVSDWTDFPNPDKPFPFIESVNTHDFKDLIEDVNFTGVKIGDVNNSISLIGIPFIDARSDQTAIIYAEDKSFESGEKVDVQFSMEDLSQVKGSQYTIEFDAEVLSFTGIESSAAFMDASNYGVRFADQGKITVSWNLNEATQSTTAPLFRISFETKRAGTISELISLTDRITKKEAYNNDLEIIDLELRFENETENFIGPNFALHQNIPNPFSDLTAIYFELPESTEASIQFFDVTGKSIKIIEGNYKKGLNIINVSKESLNTIGVIYYKLETGSFTQTRKMICIK